MRLDKFQQFVKDGKYGPDLNVIESKAMVRRLITEFPNKADDIESNVNGAIGWNTFYENSVFHIESLSTMAMNGAIKAHINNLIRETTQEIEDIEADDEFEPEDCCDAHKRNVELNQ